MNYKGNPTISRDAWIEIADAHLLAYQALARVVTMPRFSEDSDSGRMAMIQLELAGLRVQEALLKSRAVRRGRPFKKTKGNGLIPVFLNEIEQGSSQSRDQVDHDVVVYRTIERIRQEQLSNNETKGTVTAAVDAAILARLAPAFGLNNTNALKKFRGRVRNKYSRGKKKTLNRSD